MTEQSAQCSSCLEESPLETSFLITKRGKSVDLNGRTVYHSIETGGGYEGLASFRSIMNMPCLSKPAYYQHVETILDALELEAQEEMKAAGQRLREHILKENGEQNSDSVVDTAVSFDGTWAKRGFSSLTGVVFVLSVNTGEVLDYHVLSKSCQRVAVLRMMNLTSGKWSTLHQVNVTLTFMVVHLPWRQRELKFYGTDH